jgi:hypothetical protein
MLRLLRIVHPRNTRLSLPRRKSTNRVFAGCSVNPSRSITSPIRRSASLAVDSVRHMATKSSAYRISFPSWPHRATQIRSSLLYRLFTGRGQYRPARSATSISARNFPTPRCAMAWIVSASTPAAPRLPRTRLHASHRTSLLRSGHTAHGNAASYSPWRTHIACVGVLVLFHWGCWPLPACPRTYLLASTIKARPLPSSVLSCTPSQVHRASRTPSRRQALSAFRPYMLGLARRGGQVGSLLFRTVLSRRATACDPGEIQHPFRSGMLSVAFAVT